MIPPDLVEDQDAEFYSEIIEVNDLYFGNFDVEDTEVKSDHNHDTDDNDSESDSDCDNANISHNLDNDSDLKEADKSEYDLLSQFKKQTCGCNRLYGSPCSANVDWESVIEYRRHCQEMTNDELDVAIKFQLFHHRRNDSVTDKKKHKSKERERSRQEYFFSGKRVCRVTFAFAHGVNRKKVDAIAHSLDNEGLGQAECSNQTRMHYSFDYAQQVHYPHYAQQVRPLFFKTPRKCQCFGVCAEGSGKVSRHNPGILFVKEYANSPEVEINVLRNQNCRFPHLDPELPAVISPKGLDPARQWYLYEEVAPYCNNKDSCKKPDVTKPILKAEQSEEYDKKRKCSHCKSCGHTKSRGGIITCPKLL
ncbi:hypothetical protein KUTeg_015796 [Tegillarca granosa]|uniref:Uncharacterized protein n=1 Tax=Tegillarca granosa TaxID=220873 RepID=A0ABQ9ELK1_TEGGR|nr:hypothetical protein KUTeg_015796 [Tegillarca granosa]